MNMVGQSLEIDDWAVEIDCVDREGWSRVLEAFSDASIYQTWEYGAVRWGEQNLSRVIVRSKEKIISAAQVRIFKIPRTRQGMAYVFYGPMWRVQGQDRCIANFQLGLQALIDEYASKRGLFLRLRPWGFCERDGDMESTLVKEGFGTTRGIYSERKRTILVDLRPPEEDMRKKLKKKWRQTLQHAEREDLQIVEGFEEGLFESFKPLFGETVELKKFKPGADVNEFAEIQKQLPQRHKMRTSICRMRGDDVSASVCSSFGEVVIGLLSATGEAGRKVQAYYLLQWDEILWAKRMGKTFYDLGGINPETNPGVYRFKAGIGGEEVTLLGVFDFCKNRVLYHATISFERLLRLRNRMRF